MPVVATRVHPQPPPPPPDQPVSAALAQLHPGEREYVRTQLRKRERTQLLSILDNKRARETTTPLRIQVLQSNLPEAVRVQIFEELRTNGCEKYVQWVRRALRLPLGVVHGGHAAVTVAAAVERAKGALDRHIAGHDAAKREVLQMVCQQRAGGTTAAVAREGRR